MEGRTHEWRARVNTVMNHLYLTGNSLTA